MALIVVTLAEWVGSPLGVKGLQRLMERPVRETGPVAPRVDADVRALRRRGARSVDGC